MTTSVASFPKATLKAVLVGGGILILSVFAYMVISKRPRHIIYDADPETGDPVGKPKSVMCIQFFGKPTDHTV